MVPSNPIDVYLNDQGLRCTEHTEPLSPENIYYVKRMIFFMLPFHHWKGLGQYNCVVSDSYRNTRFFLAQLSRGC